MHRIRIRKFHRSPARCAGVIALTAGLFLLPGASLLSADSHSADEAAADQAEFENSWHPELGLGFVLHVQDLEASATPNFIQPSALSPDSDKAISPGFRLSAAMISPVLVKDSAWKPRFFVKGALQYLLEEEYTAYRGFVSNSVQFTDGSDNPNCDVPQYGQNVKGNGPIEPFDPSGGQYNSENYPGVQAALPNLYNNTYPPNADPADYINFNQGGQSYGGYAIGGSDCEANFRAKASIDLMWGAGVGFEVTLPVLSRQFHLRTSVEYVGQSFGPIRATYDRTGSFDVCTTPFNPATHPGQPFAGCASSTAGVQITHPKFNMPQVTAYAAGSGFTTHGIGPRVQLDVDVFKRGDVRMSLFLELGFAWLMGTAGSTASLTVPDQIYNCSIERSRLAATNAYNISGGIDACKYVADGDTPQVDFAVSPDDFIAQGGGGIRIVWSPPW